VGARVRKRAAEGGVEVASSHTLEAASRLTRQPACAKRWRGAGAAQKARERARLGARVFLRIISGRSSTVSGGPVFDEADGGGCGGWVGEYAGRRR